MQENEAKGKKSLDERILNALMENPTRSDMEIARDLGTYRQKVWRKKKQLEEDNIIWGYTAVLDEKRLGHVSYMVLMKTKPMTEGLVNTLLQRITREEPRKQDVRLTNFFYVNGEYDFVLRFSAPDHATARRYYDTLRLLYDEHLLDKPVMIDVNMCLVSEGKRNPDIESLHDFIPVSK
ncbi:MAG: Lrp/AsnC family transcriptional regulator [Thermoplasmata archaeon]